jgi:diadenosine tetraphosphate (Ap4A) HIT family hydrolase
MSILQAVEYVSVAVAMLLHFNSVCCYMQEKDIWMDYTPTICVFCEQRDKTYVYENTSAYAMYDSAPVTPLHALIIPKRHIPDYFDLSDTELSDCHELLRLMREEIQKQDPSVQAFNVGINVGETAGQTIFHCHIHLIPRRKGDIENPRGGIRHVIPGKGFY